MTQEQYLDHLRGTYDRVLLSKAETAKELNISISTMDRLRKDGLIRSKRILGQIHFAIDEVARFLAND